MASKTVFITGATSGIGRDAAIELARRGHHVIATGRREDALAALAEDARSAIAAGGRGGALETVRMDVTDAAEVSAVAARVLAGRAVDVVINNAGFGQMGPLETVTDAALRAQFETNVFGLMSVTRAFLPSMRARGTGRVVNVGSIGGRVTFPLMGAYNATKYAVESLSDALRNEVAPFGLQVSIVEPGPIKTEFNDRALATIDVARTQAGPWAPVLGQVDQIRAQFDRNAALPASVTRAIVHAVEAKRPRVRYVMPFSAAISLAVLELLPTRLVDLVMRWALGLTTRKLAAGQARAAIAAG